MNGTDRRALPAILVVADRTDLESTLETGLYPNHDVWTSPSALGAIGLLLRQQFCAVIVTDAL